MAPTFFACCLYLQGLTPEVIEHAQAGVAAAQQGRLGVAIQEFRKVAELQPNSPVAHARLGDAYFQNADYAAAIPELEAALRLDPNLNDTHQTLGVILLLQGNPEGALAHLEKLRTPELLGLAYLETGRLGPAISALHAALNRQPNDLNLLYYFGRATALASKRSLDELAKVNPSLARKSVAAADKESRPPQDAPQDVVSLQSALAKRPYDADLLFAFSRATALASTRSFDRILQLDATSARAHQVLAERDLEGGRLPEAEREYVESLWQKPYTANVHLALGNVFAAERKWSDAVAQYRMEAQLRPFSADAFYSLGSLLLQQGQTRGAVDELLQADRLRPDTPQILLALGKAAFAAHDTARAEASWTKLLGIDKQSGLAASAHQGLSALYRNDGRSQEADRELAAYEQLRTKGAAN
ncbi:MAG TPA: tetratricopeptide repeat protein [Bryobacteraceae bacterium]|nr:tetratricopeptide repeat protein [Bryobacteraceae bacterium]